MVDHGSQRLGSLVAHKEVVQRFCGRVRNQGRVQSAQAVVADGG